MSKCVGWYLVARRKVYIISIYAIFCLSSDNTSYPYYSIISLTNEKTLSEWHIKCISLSQNVNQPNSKRIIWACTYMATKYCSLPIRQTICSLTWKLIELPTASTKEDWNTCTETRHRNSGSQVANPDVLKLVHAEAMPLRVCNESPVVYMTLLVSVSITLHLQGKPHSAIHSSLFLSFNQMGLGRGVADEFRDPLSHTAILVEW